MIPKFPQFKKLELADKKEIEGIVLQYLPYSDFNFISMWIWNIQEKISVSILNGNLVVQFMDYITRKPFYSFLGNNEANDTAEKLLELSQKEGLRAELRLVPEEVIQRLDIAKFKIKEDRNNFDYIYKTENLAKMSGRKFEVKRKHFRFFKKNFSHEVKVLDLHDSLVKKEIIDLFNDWIVDKEEMMAGRFENELLALNRFLKFCQPADFFTMGIYLKGKLIAFSITENIHGGYNLGHFQKSRTSFFKGLNDYLVNELAKLLMKGKVQYMNCEQDLGIAGLRESKEAYSPHRYLKKFTVSFTH